MKKLWKKRDLGETGVCRNWWKEVFPMPKASQVWTGSPWRAFRSLGQNACPLYLHKRVETGRRAGLNAFFASSES